MSKNKSKSGKNGEKGGKKRSRLKKKAYEAALADLQVELVKLQAWVREHALRIVVVFEGRDAAGKGGTIKRITERVSPSIFRTVALPAPSDREKTQFYWQRYMAHLPAAGEVVLFDRSWYNRAGVERVMGFCTDDQYERFMTNCAGFEHALVEDGIVLVKFWLTVTDEMQRQRFEARIEDPIRQWKLSPMDLQSRIRWFEYSRARDAMLDATDTDFAPWTIVPADDQRRARLNCIAHLLSTVDYGDLPHDKVTLPDRDMSDAYDDEASLAHRRFVENKY